jgi:hypothetical protein
LIAKAQDDELSRLVLAGDAGGFNDETLDSDRTLRRWDSRGKFVSTGLGLEEA